MEHPPQKIASGRIDPELFAQFHLGDVPLGQGIEDFANCLSATFGSTSCLTNRFPFLSPSRLSDCFTLRPALLVCKMKLGSLDAKRPLAGGGESARLIVGADRAQLGQCLLRWWLNDR